MIKLKSLLVEGFNQNSKIANAILGAKKLGTQFYGTSQRTIDLIRNSELLSKTIFELAALYPCDTFKISHIDTGIIYKTINSLYLSGNEQKQKIKQAEAIKSLLDDLDAYFGSRKDWLNSKNNLY